MGTGIAFNHAKTQSIGRKKKVDWDIAVRAPVWPRNGHSGRII